MWLLIYLSNIYYNSYAPGFTRALLKPVMMMTIFFFVFSSSLTFSTSMQNFMISRVYKVWRRKKETKKLSFGFIMLVRIFVTRPRNLQYVYNQYGSITYCYKIINVVFGCTIYTWYVNDFLPISTSCVQVN